VIFSAEEGIVRGRPLPGLGGSTPLLWNDSLFLTAVAEGSDSVLCISTTGGLVWEQTIGEGQTGPLRHRSSSGCNPSSVVDSQIVVVYFGSGNLAALTHQGDVTWSFNLQQRYGVSAKNFEVGTSPVLAGDVVMIAVMHRQDSYVAAFDRATGGWMRNDVGADLPTPTIHEGRAYILGDIGSTCASVRHCLCRRLMFAQWNKQNVLDFCLSQQVVGVWIKRARRAHYDSFDHGAARSVRVNDLEVVARCPARFHRR
jgi:outer membrane protein assembly factor BamB